MASGLDSVLPQNMNVCKSQGKLRKGFRMPSTAPSIPTKYQTVVIHNSEPKGFNSEALRFRYDVNQNENPGPGFYDVTHGSAEIISTSLSKKGTGYFPSKASRTSRSKMNNTPAANAYSIPLRFISRKNFSLGYSSMFHRPIALRVEDRKNQTPAPNQYDASVVYSKPSNAGYAHSAFVSKTKRELLPPGQLKGPSPCHYTINDSLVKGSPKFMVSSFKSRTLRDSMNVHSSNPGPASYHPYESPEPVIRLIYPRQHYLCLSAPALPIPKTPPLPGPGQYEVDFVRPAKQCISSAVFVSNTSRWTGDVSGKRLPGPGTYDPERTGKQSFLYNTDDKWIPM